MDAVTWVGIRGITSRMCSVIFRSGPHRIMGSSTVLAGSGGPGSDANASVVDPENPAY